MYLISIYFDEATNKTIQNLIKQIARNTGNTYMLDRDVPPHITISSFEAKCENKIINCLEECVKHLRQGDIQWVSIGAFLPYVIYLAPVLDEYLHGISTTVYNSLLNIEDISISKYYRPFQWLPHTTVGKKLLQKEMQIAFETLQKQFTPFVGSITKIGLAKTNPYRDIAVFELEER